MTKRQMDLGRQRSQRSSKNLSERVKIPQESNRTISQQIVLALAIFVVVGAIGGATIWILSIENIISGPWSAIMAVVLTVLGLLLSLLQLQSPNSLHIVMPLRTASEISSD